MSTLALLDRCVERELTTYGFRLTFRGWDAESTNYSTKVVEIALAHANDGKIEGAQRSGEYCAEFARAAVSCAVLAALKHETAGNCGAAAM
ncbi:hypothetical protein [Bradyrhizobium sp. LB11.1]|uniref:hypothetical protein n=1 Tax=Bradyrhizobium sp. LB11.1 TaxID=3156326 RepID=UPI00339418C9